MAQIKTLRKIAERMGWSPAKVLRRHKLDDFPLYPDWTKRGLIWVTSDELILVWEQNKVQMNQGARLRPPPRPRQKPTYHPYNWRLRYKNETPGRTIGGPQIEGEKPEPTREGPCPCGVPDRCLVHGDSGLTLREEPPVKVESQPEPPAVQLPGPPVNQSTPRERSGIKRIEGCVCGKGLTCTAHD